MRSFTLIVLTFEKFWGQISSDSLCHENILKVLLSTVFAGSDVWCRVCALALARAVTRFSDLRGGLGSKQIFY